MPGRRGVRRALRILGRILLVAAGLVVLVLVALLLPPVRDALLPVGLRIANRSLPGILTVNEPSWPGPGHLVLRGVLWRDGADTLLAADEISVRVSLAALSRKDVVVHDLTLAIVTVDVPAITARFVPSSPPSAPAPAAPPAFPRPGAIPGVPSIRVDAVDLRAGTVRAAPGLTVRDLELAAAVDVGHGAEPSLDLRRLRVVVLEPGLTVDEASLRVRKQSIDGEVTARYEPVGLVHARFDTPETGVVGIVLSRDGTAPPDAPGVALRIRPRFREGALRGAGIEAVVTAPATRELGDYPAFAESAAQLPDLDRLTLDITGDAELDPRSVRFSVESRPAPWLNRLSLRGRATPEHAVLDSLSLGADGLAVQARAAAGRDSLSALATVRVTGLNWLSPFAALPPEVEHVDLDTRLEVSGPPAHPRIEATVRGDAVVSELAFRLGLDAAATPGDTTVVDLMPIQLLAPDTPFRAPGGKPGRVRLTPGGVSVDGISVVGAAGDIELSADLDTARSGHAEASWRWAGAPGLILQLLPLDPGTAEAWRANWPSGEGKFVSVVADMNGGDTPEVNAEITFALPGPEDLTPLLPAGARVQGLGALRGTAHVEAALGDDPTAAVTLDLGATEWLDAGLVRGQVSSRSAAIDTLALALEGVAVHAAGRVDSLLALSFDAAVTSMEFANRFLDTGADTLDVQLTATGRIEGDRHQPSGTVALHGAAARGAVLVPRFEGGARLDSGALEAWVGAPDGMTAGGIALDRLGVRYTTTPADTFAFFPGRLSLEAGSTMWNLRQSLLLDLTDGITVDVDTLVASVQDRDLRAERPFRVRQDRAGVLTVSDVRLAGSLGRLEADVVRDSLTTRGSVLADLQVPAEIPGLALPAAVRPDRVRVEARSDPDSGLTAEVEVTGLPLREGESYNFRGSVVAGLDRTSARIRMAENGNECVRGDVVLPLVLDPQTGSYRVTSDPLQADLEFVDLPVPVSDRTGQPAPLVNGTAKVSGTARFPNAATDLEVTFPGWPVISDRRLRFRGDVQTESEAALRADLALEGVNDRLLHGTLVLPLRWDPDSLFVEADRGRDMELTLVSDHLDLSIANPALPPSFSLGGALDVNIKMSGRVGALDLAGHVKAVKLEAGTSDGSRVTFNGDLTLGGTADAPSIQGHLDVLSGVIRIPDPPKSLHPVKGDVVLWSAGMEPPRREGAPGPATADSTRPPITPDVKVDVTIPSGVWIRGRQIDAELSGELSVAQGAAGLPTVTGDLKVGQGSFTLLGRRFEAKEGSVTFYGDDELDPTLDLTLTSTIDNVTVDVLLSGTASKPELELQADDASMTDADIMSLILFGKKENPDDAELDLLAKRSQDVLAAYAAAELNEQLAGQFGVDMISVRATSGERALVIGKYLNPKTLITYEQALDTAGDSFVKIQYLLTRRIKLDYRYGQDQSGLDLNWSLDY